MVKAQGLRVGNYLIYNGDYFCVNFIMPKCIIVADRGRGNVDFHIDDLKPIPLSEEILLKCGFEKQPTVDGLSKVTYDINSRQQFAWYSIDNVLRFQTIGSGYVMDWNIKYLHQLQNAFFVVTQKELEIEL